MSQKSSFSELDDLFGSNKEAYCPSYILKELQEYKEEEENDADTRTRED